MGWLSKVGSFVKDNVHGILDVAGMIPGVGAVADLANAAIYAAEGDWVNAGLSAVSAIPGVGDTIALANKGVKVAKGVKAAVKGGKGLKAFLKVGGKSLLKGIKGKMKVGAKLLKKLNPKKLFKGFKNGFKKIFLEAKCFTGDTLVYTEKGMVPIKEVKVGDLIYAKNEETGEVGLKSVERTSETAAHTIYRITIDNREIVETTGYHGFYTEGLEWVNAINLKVGDKLVSEEGIRCITSVEKSRSEEPVSVYNFVVEEWHTFFVTEGKICVHNSLRHILKKGKDKLKDMYTKVKQKIKRVVKGEPVDVVTGVVLCESIDFEFPGIIPLSWERRYYSDNTRVGILGHGTFANYETELIVPENKNTILLLLPDGRATAFDRESLEGGQYNRVEKLTLSKEEDAYEVYYHTEKLIYVYRNEKKRVDIFSLEEIRDEAGHQIKFQYSNGNLTDIIDSAGRKLKVNNDEQGRIVDIRFASKKLVSYGYGMEGDLVSIKDALNQEKMIQYKNHLMVKTTTKDGCSFYWEYDSSEQNAKCLHTWGDGGALEYHFEYGDGVNYNTNSLGYREAVYYDDSNLITKYVDAEGNATEYKYNEFEEMVSTINALGFKTSFVYDDKGNVIEQTEPSGVKTTFDYDEVGRQRKITYPNGGITELKYDVKGNIERIIHPDKSEIKYKYNKENLMDEIEDTLENKTKFYYDKMGNLTEVVQPDGSKMQYEYDEIGNCLKIINPFGAEQLLLYDDMNRVVKAMLPDGNVIHMKYNAFNEVLLAKDKLQRVEFEYTWSGKIKKRKEGSRTIEYVYDTQEQLLSLINEEGNLYSFKYDGNGNVIEENGFDGLKHRFTYDKVGHVIKVERPGGKEKVYDYDANGKIIGIKYNNETMDKFKYNEMGNLVETENENCCIKFELDIMGKIKKETQNGHIIEYEYDDLGHRTNLKSSLGVNINQSYDSYGEVSTICSTSSTDSTWISKTIYNPLGQELSSTMSGGISSKWEYDKIGRPIIQSVEDTNRNYSRKYNWNIRGQLKSIVYAGRKITYSYDEYGYLEWSGFNAEDIFRKMDYFGNIFKTKEQNDRVYGKAGQILKSTNSQYKYDEQGNLIEKSTKDKTWKYMYYDNGFMSKVIRPDGNTIEFKYDSLGRRIEKKFNSQVKKFLWDGNVILHEWNEKDSEIENVITWVFNQDSYTPIAKITERGIFGIISDHIGTPIEMYSEKGDQVWSSMLDIYGSVKQMEINEENCPFRFSGQYEDEETGLYYNRFRYYSPREGMYIQQDPIRTKGGWNLYAYVYDTIQLTDPLGLAPPNKGLAGKHGGTVHNKFIDDIIQEIINNTNGQAQNIRKNQQQHNFLGIKVGNNRPDVQYDYQGIHYNIEVDTTQSGSLRHRNTIPINDPNARNTYWIIDDSGNVTGEHSQLPQSAGPSKHSNPNSVCP